MKLKNKKTGKVIEWFNNTDGIFPNTLAELNKEWEDVPEELKEYWYVNDLDGELMKCELQYCPVRDFTEWSEKRKQIGNYFETKEEAELAVRKLKAWKRLKDKGFEFINFPYKKICKYDARTGVGNLEYQVKYYEELEPDLDICFGGEE